jgi:predicted nucleic-acid-binding Zn-ribbon protein
MPDPNCVKCGRSMEKGVIPDVAYGSIRTSHWQQGRERGLFGSLKIRNQTRYEIGAWRCTSCGYLELYAADEKSW